MSLDLNMEKVYEFMQPISDVLNKVYDYAVEFTDGMTSSLANVITIFGYFSQILIFMLNFFR